ncbi:MAG: MarR family transcriptional regulator [Ferruginibacter sp.]|nr:MarR family transcriptional regulator [Cytophagales bacterium]
MAIEEDIQQTSFTNPYQKVFVNLMFTHNWLVAQHTRLLKPFCITREQYNVLRILRGQHPKPATVNLITERMLDKMSNASRLVDKLLVKKLVQRHVCPNDRRAVDVCITPEGLNLLAKLDVLHADWEKTFENLTDEEADSLSTLLDKLRG